MDAMEIIVSVGGIIIVALTGVVWAFVMGRIASAAKKAEAAKREALEAVDALKEDNIKAIDGFKRDTTKIIDEFKKDFGKELEKAETNINKLFEDDKNIREVMRQEQNSDMQRREAFGSRLFTEIKSLSEKWETKLNDLTEKVNDLEVTTSGMQSTYLTRTEYEQRRKKPDTVIIARDSLKEGGRS